MTATSDENLPAPECNGLSHIVLGRNDAAGQAEDVDAAMVISNRLREYCNLMDTTMRMDPVISQQDNNIIERAIPVGATASSMNLQLLKQHLVKVLRSVFSIEFVQSCE